MPNRELELLEQRLNLRVCLFRKTMSLTEKIKTRIVAVKSLTATRGDRLVTFFVGRFYPKGGETT